MPSESQAQHGFMSMATTSYGRSKLKAEGKKPPPASVAREYVDADKGRNIKRLAHHVRKK